MNAGADTNMQWGTAASMLQTQTAAIPNNYLVNLWGYLALNLAVIFQPTIYFFYFQFLFLIPLKYLAENTKTQAFVPFFSMLCSSSDMSK